MLSLLLSRTGLTIGGIGLAVILAYSWHRAQIRAEQQKVEAETRSAVVTELGAQHAAERAKYEERIADLETRFNELARTRAQSVQRIEVITKEAEVQREEAPMLDSNSRRANIRARLASPVFPFYERDTAPVK